MFVSLLLTFKSSLYILSIIHYHICVLERFLSQSVVVFYPLNGIFCRVEFFNFNDVQLQYIAHGLLLLVLYQKSYH
jgi:hypothetical protein